MKWIYGLVDMQSFYASCEVASRPEYALARRENDDSTDPLLVVSGDPGRRSGVILAATPTAKKAGIENAMRLGEALRYCPTVTVVKPRMQFYLETSIRIQQVIQSMFPLHEQFSVDEAFFAFPFPSILFPDPITAVRQLKESIWDLFRLRCRIGLSYNKWMAKMANKQAKKHPDGIVWWTEEDVPTKLHRLSVFDMWGLKRRAESLYYEFGARTIGDVAQIPEVKLQHRFGVWGTVIYRWSHGRDYSRMNPDSYDVPHKGISHRTTLPKDFYKRTEIIIVIQELLDEVCRRARSAGQKGRRVGLGLTYERLQSGFYKAKTLHFYSNEPHDLYPFLLELLDKWWTGDGVRAVSVSLDLLQHSNTLQLSLLDDVSKRHDLSRVVDEIRTKYGEASIMRAVSLQEAGQLRERSKKIGGHYM
ncbi:DNA polymerase IV [Effusibacillus lacus]|uniref:DNA polymerase IV n=1 Tax=Effusibacillus lacus TaxID=1348429 RepID=A0A292YGV3_9BACL|nr:DNA polymerase IV [Effusibacillus lacus]TCS71251.1 DNA polymerase-4/DNA polymerase V [Effusibacillus lacus]GAX89877.1 DNA polymerase IV [Effusibacillus lacus]